MVLNQYASKQLNVKQPLPAIELHVPIYFQYFPAKVEGNVDECSDPLTPNVPESWCSSCVVGGPVLRTLSLKQESPELASSTGDPGSAFENQLFCWPF